MSVFKLLRQILTPQMVLLFFLVSGTTSFAFQAMAGKSVTLSVTANGTPPFSYQWRKDNMILEGANTATYQIASLRSSDTGTYTVVVSNSAGSTTSLPAAVTITPPLFQFPVGIATDSAGSLYVSDSGADAVLKVTQSATIALSIGSPGKPGVADGNAASAQFNNPTGVAVATNGAIYVTDTANGTIRQITPTGTVSTLAGSTTNRGNQDGIGAAATFSSPVAVAIDGTGVLYVTDALNHTIRQISPGGTVNTLAGSAGSSGSADGTGSAARFNHPTGIAVDRAGNVYVADTTNNTVRKITTTGEVTTLAGLPGVSGAQDGRGNEALFNNPVGLAVNASGTVFLSDTGNSTVRQITPAGVVTTLAGMPGVAGFRDGTNNAAWFHTPQGLALDATGNVYVADTGNAAIRKVTLAGAVSTIDPSDNSETPNNAGSPSTPAPAAPGNNSSGGGGGGDLGADLTFALVVACLLRQIVCRRAC